MQSWFLEVRMLNGKKDRGGINLRDRELYLVSQEIAVLKQKRKLKLKD